MEAKKNQFKAEIAEMLDLVVNSLYSKKEIFLRELVSNASDAIDKAKFKGLTEKALVADNPDWRIDIAVDSAAKTMMISDNGIGMDDKELEQNLGGSEAVFGNYALTMQKTAEQAYKNMGLSESAYLQTANKMGALFQGTGFTAQKSADMTKKAMQRAADMASVMGVDLSQAMESVAGAAKGNFTMMDNLGVAINDTTLKLYAQEKGLGDLETTQDKVNAAMQLFLEKTEQYDGNFAREAEETISGSLGLVKSAFDNLVTGLGSDTADVEGMTDVLMDALMSVVNNIKPVIENMVKALPKVVKTAIKAMQSILPTIIPSLVDMVVQSLPVMMELGATILKSLADAIIDQLPQLLNTAIELVLMLANGIAEALPTLVPTITEIMLLITNTLLDNIDALVDASIAIMLALSEGMINAMPIILEQAPVIVEKLVTAVKNNAPKILGAALLLIESLVKGLIDNLPLILDSGKQILETLWNALKSGYNRAVETGTQIVTWVGDGIKSMVSSAVQWGKDLIQGLIDGIKGKIADIKNAVGEVAETIKSYLHFSVPDVGPLTTYESWMPDFMHGLAQGIRANKHLVTEAMQDLTSDMSVNANASLSGGGGIGSQVINVNWYGNVSSNMDLQDSARQIGQMLQSEMSANASMKGLYA